MSITIYHAQEQVNTVVKAKGSAFGISKNPTALRGRVVASSKLARMVEAFNDVILTSESQNHHENRPAIQNNFVKDVVNQVSSFEELGIPFMES